MKNRGRTLLVCALLLLFNVVAYAQSPTPIDQLRQQIQKLMAIAKDPSTDPEVRKLNQGFLAERRARLSALLREKLTTLQGYQSKVSDILTDAEKQALTLAVGDLQNEITALNATNVESSTSGVADAVAPATPPVESVTANGTSGPSDAPAMQPAASGNGSSNSGGANLSGNTPANPPAAAANSPSVQTPPTDLDTWLNARIEERIKAVAQARIDQNSNVNQTETPAIGDNSTSLVDQSSASDLVGLALNLAGLTGGNNTGQSDKTTAAVTATAYSLYSMFKGEQPLDPSFYNKYRNWRRLSFTLGFTTNQTNTLGQPIEDTTIVGAKYLIVAGRDAAKHQKDLKTVYTYLKAAAVNLAQLNDEIRNALKFSDPTLRDKLRIDAEVRTFVQQQLSSGLTSDRTLQFQKLLAEPIESWFDPKKTDFAHLAVRDFVENKYFDSNGFPLLLRVLDEEALKEIDALIDARLDAFTGLNNAARRAIEQIRKAPQFSLAFQSKLHKLEPDEYKGQAIFEYGLHDRVNLTLNGSFVYKNSRLIGADTRRAQFAGQLQFQMTPEKSLAGRSPLYLFLASEGDWGNGINSIFKVQGKVKIPLFDGVDFPISLTYANRTELISERDVRGQFGFTFDTAKLLRAFLSKR